MNIREKFDELNLKIIYEKNSEYINSTDLAKKLFIDLINNEQTKFLPELISKSLVIKSHPKRIIKKGTKSQAGTQFESSIMCLLNYEYVTFNEVQISPVLLMLGEESILDHKLQIFAENPNLWILKNMRWTSKSVGRSSRKSTCDKYVIRFNFSAKYCCQNLLRSIEKSLYSDTLVIVVHSNQEVDSYMTLFWDDYYRVECNPEILNFICKPHSDFHVLIDNLSLFFSKETNRPLTEHNKRYLFNKIRDIFPSSEVITNDDFMKRPMQNLKISFGQWIMSIIKMLKIPSVEKLWIENRIEGFIAKNVQDLLEVNGAFLLRFSERQSAIGVVVRNENDETEAWEPYTDANLRQSNLANLLFEFNQLKVMRLSNGQFLLREEALYSFMDPVEIDDGYTRRGGNQHEISEMSFETSPAVFSVFSSGLSTDRETDSNVDINEIEDICSILLRNNERLD